MRDVLPEPLVRLVDVAPRARDVGVDELGPRRRRDGDDAPARRHPVDDLSRLREVGEEVTPGARGIEALERAGRVRAGERDARGVLVGEVVQPLPHPRRHVVERVLVGERDPLALQPLIEVEDVDELRAAFVRRARDLAREHLLADVARDRDELPRLDVRAEDRELGEPVGERVDPGRSLELGHRVEP